MLRLIPVLLLLLLAACRSDGGRMIDAPDSAAVNAPGRTDTADGVDGTAPSPPEAGADTVGQEAEESTPPQRYVDRGVCPFECCTYREWEARETLTAYQAEGDTSEVAFTIPKGEAFEGLTGDVIVDPVGVAVANDTVTYDAPDHRTVIAPGDTVYVLSHLGEGVFHVWHDGEVEEVYAFWAVTGLEGEGTKGKLLREPVPHWWAKVRNEQGQTGWLDMDALGGKIAGIDACG